MPIDALSVLCAQLTRDLLAIAKFLFTSIWLFNDFQYGGRTAALALASCKNKKTKTKKPKKLTFWCAKLRMRGNETHGRIVTNFYTDVGVHDVITSANFYDCRLWGLSVVGVGGQILGFSIESRRRPYNTLALPCECVMFLASRRL